MWFNSRWFAGWHFNARWYGGTGGGVGPAGSGADIIVIGIVFKTRGR